MSRARREGGSMTRRKSARQRVSKARMEGGSKEGGREAA